MCGTRTKNSLVLGDITADINKGGFNYAKKGGGFIKDNMGDNATGASPILFDYFDEFEEIFGYKPSIKSTHIASTSAGKRSLDEVEIEETKTESPSKKVKKAGATRNDFSVCISNFEDRDKKIERGDIDI